MNDREPKTKMTIFRFEDAQELMASGMMDPPTVVPGALDGIDGDALGALDLGSVVKTLFREPGDGGFSLVHARWAPNYPLPRHSHSADCLYYVVSGTIVLGRQVLGPRCGFFVPSGHPYGYHAGPDGAEVLEFRHATSFDMQIVDGPDQWQAIAEIAAANRTSWAAQAATG